MVLNKEVQGSAPRQCMMIRHVDSCLCCCFLSFRASDWKLDAPDWDGRLRVVAKGKELFIKLEDKTSGMGTNLYYRDEFNSFQIFMSIKWVGCYAL